MELIIKPNWSTGSLLEISGQYIPFQIGVGRTRLRFWSSVDIDVNKKILIIQQGGIESRNIVRSVVAGGPLPFLIEVELIDGEYAFPNPILHLYEIDDSASYYLDGSIDLRLNISIIDIREGVKSSAFTKTFDVPFTPNNNRIFTQVFNINADSGYNTKKKSDFLITNGGALISSGYIQILDIDFSGKLYKCVYYGDNMNLFDDIGEKLITGNDKRTDDIYFDDLIHNVSDTEVIAGWDRERPYIYGLLNDENNVITKSVLRKPNNTGIEGWRWKMWFKSSELFKRIFNKWGYTFTSEFINSEFFDKHCVLPANGFTIGQPIIKWTNDVAYPLTVFSVPPQPITFAPLQLLNEDINFFGGVSRDPVTGRFIIPAKGDYRFSAIVNFGKAREYSIAALLSQNVDTLRLAWRIYRGGKRLTTLYGQTFRGKRKVEIGQPVLTARAIYTPIEIIWEKETLIYPMLQAGDEIEFGINGLVHKTYVATGLNERSGNPFPDEQNDFLSILSSKIGANPGALFSNIKQIDFIGDIFKQFNLYIKPDKTNPRHFLIEPRDDFYRTGKVVDFLDYDQDEVLITTGNDLFAKTWFFSYKEGDDIDNKLFQQKYTGRVFGDAIIKVDNDFLENERDIELEAMPILYSRIFDNFILANITDGQKSGQLRYSLYTGKTVFDGGFTAIYEFPAQSGPQPAFNYYPLFSNYSDGLGEGKSILFATSRNTTERENSLYYDHWEGEVETYANPNSHILTLKIKLNSNILQQIDFNDIYWFEIGGVGRYYTLLEITEYNPEETDMVKMEFLTYIDFRADRPKRGRPVWGLDGDRAANTLVPDDIVISPILIDRDYDNIDDSWGDTPNSPINGKDSRGSDNIFIGDSKYPTLIGDNIIVEDGVDVPFIGGNNITIGTAGSNAFVWNANDVNVEAKVVSWGAVGKTHSIDSSFLFNEFNPVLESKDQAVITNSEDGTMVWNAVEETLYVSKNNVWLPVGGGVGTDYINIFDFTSSSVTTFLASDQFEPLNMNSIVGFSEGALSDDGNGLITYSGSSPKIFKLQGIASGSSGPNNEIHFAFFKNGLLWPCSEQSGIAGVGGRATAVPFQCVVELDDTDTIQVYVKNSSGVTSFTLQNINMIIERI